MSEPRVDQLPQNDDNPYHYFITEWVAITFIVLFGLSTALHVGQAVWFRTWWMFATAILCGLGEVIGWSARLWSSINPDIRTPFLMQISSTIIAPTFLLAANFIALGRIIRIVGFQYSRLTPAAYGYLFLTADLAALIVQAIGGGRASAADDLAGANRGGNIMLGGIALQFAVLIIYVITASEFLIRAWKDKPVRRVPEGKLTGPRFDGKVNLMILGLCISAVFLFIRTVYRTVELQDGWNGDIISNQTLFNTLDGLPIVAAMLCLNLFHPGLLVFNKSRILDDDKTIAGDAGLKEKNLRSRSGSDTAIAAAPPV